MNSYCLHKNTTFVHQNHEISHLPQRKRSEIWARERISSHWFTAFRINSRIFLEDYLLATLIPISPKLLELLTCGKFSIASGDQILPQYLHWSPSCETPLTVIITSKCAGERQLGQVISFPFRVRNFKLFNRMICYQKKGAWLLFCSTGCTTSARSQYAYIPLQLSSGLHLGHAKDSDDPLQLPSSTGRGIVR